MKYTLSLLFALSMFSANAQTSVYHPFPDSSAMWRQTGYVNGFWCCCTGFGPCLKEDDYEFFLQGDTSIGSIAYKKIYLTGLGVEHLLYAVSCSPGCSNSDYYYYNNEYAGSIRQDTALRKVYFMPPGHVQDTLLYDFDLQVGDT